MSQYDIIDELVGSPLELRKRRPITKDQAQKSYEALFSNIKDSGFSLKDRFAIATFVSRLHGFDSAINFYENELKKLQPDWAKIIEEAANAAKSTGPFGKYPDGPLTKENTAGKSWSADAGVKNSLGEKLAAALNHSHILVFHPRDSEPTHLEALKQAGWSNDEIVTLSQLVAFLSFQLRLSLGLKALSASKDED